MKKFADIISLSVDDLFLKMGSYIQSNSSLIFILVLVALTCYGFELFNFNLSIDEELFAKYSEPQLLFINQGRWGMYILNAIFMPRTVLPFAPLFFAIIFHIGAVLFLLESWGIKSNLTQSVVGAMGIAFPSTADIYLFSPINYGIGFGFFCVAFSLYLYTRQDRRVKYFAIIPAVFAIALYQGFIPALISAFLISIILGCIRTGKVDIKEVGSFIIINIISIFIYYVVQRLLAHFLSIPKLTYVSQFFNFSAVKDNLNSILAKIWTFAAQIYVGDNAIYGIQVTGLKIFLPLVLLGLIIIVANPKLSFLNKVYLTLFAFGLISLPFLSAVIMDGHIALRSLVALPIVMMGLACIGVGDNHNILHKSTALMGWFVVFQFMLSANLLFGSSHLVLQSDRLLASRLIARIEEAEYRSESNTEVKYLEIIGYVNRPSTVLMPKIQDFGGSFFEWNEGSSGRVTAFLQTIGYYGLEALPQERRIYMVEFGVAMPEWPKEGSVKIVGDTVFVKFGPYSYVQQNSICSSVKQENRWDFCK